MTESQIQKKIIDELQKEGAYVVKVISANKKGVPDILACFNGKFLGIEVKRPETRKNTSKLQDYNLRQIEDSGGVSCVMWDKKQVKELLDKI